MKNLNITFEDKDFKRVSNARELMNVIRGVKHTWENFILELAKSYSEDNKQ